MFIEITEYLRCPASHDPAWLVLAPARMAGRHVVSGTLGCPVCKAEYPIADGIVRFGEAPTLTSGTALPTADVVQALLGLESPGGYVALAGSAAGLAAALRDLLDQVHVVTVNATGDPGPGVPRLASAAGLPLRDRSMRGVVLGAEVVPGLLEDAQRVVLNGQRVVALTEDVRAPERLEELAVGQGMWVGRRR